MSVSSRAGLALAALSPLAAQASFGGTPCKADFACHFEVWGLLLGVAGGIQASSVVFILLHFFFCHPERSNGRQIILGGIIGVFAFEIAALSASWMGAWGESAGGHNADYPVIGFGVAYAAMALGTVLYARSSPRRPPVGP